MEDEEGRSGEKRKKKLIKNRWKSIDKSIGKKGDPTENSESSTEGASTGTKSSTRYAFKILCQSMNIFLKIIC